MSIFMQLAVCSLILALVPLLYGIVFNHAPSISVGVFCTILGLIMVVCAYLGDRS